MKRRAVSLARLSAIIVVGKSTTCIPPTLHLLQHRKHTHNTTRHDTCTLTGVPLVGRASTTAEPPTDDAGQKDARTDICTAPYCIRHESSMLYGKRSLFCSIFLTRTVSIGTFVGQDRPCPGTKKFWRRLGTTSAPFVTFPYASTAYSLNS